MQALHASLFALATLFAVQHPEWHARYPAAAAAGFFGWLVTCNFFNGILRSLKQIF
jgi:hypothetical protein